MNKSFKVRIYPTQEQQILLEKNFGASRFIYVRQLEYKAKWYGKTISKVDRFYPSSQLCSECGYKNPALKDTNIREYNCLICGTHHDRDINAAKNILNKGLHILNMI